MALWVPNGGGDFGFYVSSFTGQPVANPGTTVTPGNNTMGSYAQVLTALAEDVFGLLINFNSNNVTTAARNTLVDIGVDPAGGTSYSVLAQELMASCAGSHVNLGSVWYYFPIWIRAGSTVAARASVNNATVGTLKCWLQAYGKPRDPRSVKVGTFIRTFGTTLASSTGTNVTPGDAAEGAWTQIGSATAEPLWWWQCGYSINDATLAAQVLHADVGIGDASNKRIVIADQPFRSNASEEVGSQLAVVGCEAWAPTGTLVYGRLQASVAANTNDGLAVYGVGG